MAQARRQGKQKRKPTRHGGASWSMLLVGLVSGAILTTLFLGARSGDDARWGSGLKTLFQSKPAAPAVPATRPDPRSDGATGPKPKLDFYTVLPEIERVIPESDFGRVDDPRPQRKPASYILQAASYRNYADADRLKAKLALAGHEAQVQKVAVQGKGVYYRVRLGPFPDKRKLKNAKQQLAKLGINALPLKLSSQ